jgi:uncharacterized membrane protein
MQEFKHLNYLLIFIAMVIWCGLFVFLPCMTHWGGLFEKLGEFGIFCFSTVCHQQPERSLQVCSHPMAVCARCAGIYFGFFGGIIVQPGLRKTRIGKIENELWWFAGFIPMGIDFLLSHIGIIESSNSIRMWTGVITGASSAFLILPKWMEIRFKK